MLDAVLRAAGRRTGLYTSPHLVDFTERIRAGGRTIPHDAVVALVAELRADARARRHRAHALRVRDAARVRVVRAHRRRRRRWSRSGSAAGSTRPTWCEPVVDGDHVDRARPRGVARARARRRSRPRRPGILKPGVPLVRRAGCRPRREAVVAARAAAVGAPLLRAGRDGDARARPDGLAFRGPGGVAGTASRLGAPGARSSATTPRSRCSLLALAPRPASRATADAVRAGLARRALAGAAGRRAASAPLVVLDGAHNPAGVAALARELPGARRRPPR